MIFLSPIFITNIFWYGFIRAVTGKSNKLRRIFLFCFDEPKDSSNQQKGREHLLSKNEEDKKTTSWKRSDAIVRRKCPSDWRSRAKRRRPNKSLNSGQNSFAILTVTTDFGSQKTQGHFKWCNPSDALELAEPLLSCYSIGASLSTFTVSSCEP